MSQEHPWLRGADKRYITVCPVCGEANEGTSEDERGTLYRHARRDYPCRLAHRRNRVGQLSQEALSELVAAWGLDDEWQEVVDESDLDLTAAVRLASIGQVG